MKHLIAATAMWLSFGVANTVFAAQHEMPASDKPAATQEQKAEKKKAKKCPEGQVYNTKDKKCVAKPKKGAATPATPATPAKPAPTAPAN